MHVATKAAHSLDPARTVYAIAAGLLLLAVTMGSIVCATESGAACPTWPGCYPDRFVPELELNPLIEFIHRVGAMSAAPFVLAAALIGRQLPADMTAVRHLPWVALVGASISGIMGMLTILTGLPKWAAVIDLLAALIAMIMMAVATLSLYAGGRVPGNGGHLGRAAWSTVGLLLAVHALGVVVAGKASFTRCMGWPHWRVLGDDHVPALQGARIALTGAAVLGVVAVVWLSRARRESRIASVVLAALVAAEILLGQQISDEGLGSALAATYSTIAVLIAWTLAVIATRAGLRPAVRSQSSSSPVLER